MSFKKKLFAVIMAASLSLGFCGQAFAAVDVAADPRCVISSRGVTYSDGTTGSVTDEFILLMVNGTLQSNAEIKYIDNIIYVPIKNVVEGIGGTFAASGNGAVITYSGLSVELTANSPVVSVLGKYYDVGAPILSQSGTVYFPLLFTINTTLGSVNIVEETPYGYPVLTVDQPVYSYYVTSNTMAQRLAYELVNAPVDQQIERYRYKDWFREMGMEKFMEAKEAVKVEILEATFEGNFSNYSYFKGSNFGYLVNRQTMEVFFAANGFVASVEDINPSALVN